MALWFSSFCRMGSMYNGAGAVTGARGSLEKEVDLILGLMKLPWEERLNTVS